MPNVLASAKCLGDDVAHQRRVQILVPVTAGDVGTLLASINRANQTMAASPWRW